MEETGCGFSGSRIYQTTADTHLPTSQCFAPETVPGKVGVGSGSIVRVRDLPPCLPPCAGGGNGRPQLLSLLLSTAFRESLRPACCDSVFPDWAVFCDVVVRVHSAVCTSFRTSPNINKTILNTCKRFAGDAKWRSRLRRQCAFLKTQIFLMCYA